MSKTVRSLYVKIVLFRAIQFSIRTQFSSIWPIDRTLSGATTTGESGPGSDCNEGVLRIPQSSSITGTSPSDCLALYAGHLLWGFTPLQRCSRCILQPQPTGLGKSAYYEYTLLCYFSVFLRIHFTSISLYVSISVNSRTGLNFYAEYFTKESKFLLWTFLFIYISHSSFSHKWQLLFISIDLPVIAFGCYICFLI